MRAADAPLAHLSSLLDLVAAALVNSSTQCVCTGSAAAPSADTVASAAAGLVLAAEDVADAAARALAAALALRFDSTLRDAATAVLALSLLAVAAESLAGAAAGVDVTAGGWSAAGSSGFVTRFGIVAVVAWVSERLFFLFEDLPPVAVALEPLVNVCSVAAALSATLLSRFTGLPFALVTVALEAAAAVVGATAVVSDTGAAVVAVVAAALPVVLVSPPDGVR